MIDLPRPYAKHHNVAMPEAPSEGTDTLEGALELATVRQRHMDWVWGAFESMLPPAFKGRRKYRLFDPEARKNSKGELISYPQEHAWTPKEARSGIQRIQGEALHRAYVDPFNFSEEDPRCHLPCTIIYMDQDTPGELWADPWDWGGPAPTWVAESSPGKYWYFWLLTEAATPEQRLQIQMALALKFGTDPAPATSHKGSIPVWGSINTKSGRGGWIIQPVYQGSPVGLTDLVEALGVGPHVDREWDAWAEYRALKEAQPDAPCFGTQRASWEAEKHNRLAFKRAQDKKHMPLVRDFVLANEAVLGGAALYSPDYIERLIRTSALKWGGKVRGFKPSSAAMTTRGREWANARFKQSPCQKWYEPWSDADLKAIEPWAERSRASWDAGVTPEPFDGPEGDHTRGDWWMRGRVLLAAQLQAQGVSTGKEGGDFGGDKVITLVRGGGSITAAEWRSRTKVGDKEECYCPFHEGLGGSPSMIHTAQGVTIHCFSASCSHHNGGNYRWIKDITAFADGTEWVGGAFLPLGQDKPLDTDGEQGGANVVPLTIPEIRKLWAKNKGTIRPLKKLTIEPEPYSRRDGSVGYGIPAGLRFDERGCILNAPTGSGKTYVGDKILGSEGLPILYIAPKEFLARQHARKYGLKDYKNRGSSEIDLQEALEAGFRGVAMCSISLCRLSNRSLEMPFVMMIDEWQTMLQINTSSIPGNKAGMIYSSLATALNKAKKWIVADANPHNLLKDQLIGMGVDLNDCVVWHVPTVDMRKICVWESRGHLLQTLIATVGEDFEEGGKVKSAIACTVRSEAEALKSVLLDTYPGLLVGIISSQEGSIEDAEETFACHDVTIYTPKCGEGVSVEIPDTHRVWGLLSRVPGMGWDTLIQMVGRVRVPYGGACNVWVHGVKNRGKSREEIVDQRINNLNATDKLRTITEEGSVVWAPVSTQQFEYVVDAEVVRGHRTADPRGSFVKTLKGWTAEISHVKGPDEGSVEFDAAIEAWKALTDAKKANKAIKVLATAESKRLTSEELFDLRQRGCQTPEEFASWGRATTLDRFGVVNEELIQDTQNHTSRIWKRVRTLTDLHLFERAPWILEDAHDKRMVYRDQAWKGQGERYGSRLLLASVLHGILLDPETSPKYIPSEELRGLIRSYVDQTWTLGGISQGEVEVELWERGQGQRLIRLIQGGGVFDLDPPMEGWGGIPQNLKSKAGYPPTTQPSEGAPHGGAPNTEQLLNKNLKRHTPPPHLALTSDSVINLSALVDHLTDLQSRFGIATLIPDLATALGKAKKDVVQGGAQAFLAILHSIGLLTALKSKRVGERGEGKTIKVRVIMLESSVATYGEIGVRCLRASFPVIRASNPKLEDLEAELQGSLLPLAQGEEEDLNVGEEIDKALISPLHVEGEGTSPHQPKALVAVMEELFFPSGTEEGEQWQGGNRTSRSGSLAS